MPEAPVTIILLAGQRAGVVNPLAARAGVSHKCLAPIRGRPLIARVLDSARDAPGCRIFIGSENRMFALSGSSVIAAPYRGSHGEVVGVVGVIGPTRLNYARVVPMVDFTAKALTRLIR